MSRFAKVYLAILGATVGFTALSAAFASMSNGSEKETGRKIFVKIMGDKAESVPVNETFKIEEGFNAVEISWLPGEIDVVALPAGETVPTLVIQGEAPKGEDLPVRFRVRDRKLEIENAEDRGGFPFTFNGNFHFAPKSLNLRLALPAAWNGELNIESVGSDVKVGALNLGTLDVETVSGDVTVAPQKMGSLQIETVSGDMNLKGLSPDEVELNSVSGDVHLSLAGEGPWKIETETVSGDVRNAKGSKSAGRPVEIETVSGNIEIE